MRLSKSQILNFWLPLFVIVAIFAFAVVLVATAQTATTQPATYGQQLGAIGQQVDDLLAAKNAQIASLRQMPQDPTIVPAGSDLASIFSGASITRYGSPGATYVWNTTIRSGMSSGGFLGTGNAVAIHPLAGGFTGIAVHDGAEIGGANFGGTGLAINATGPMKVGAYLHDLTFGPTLDWAIQLDAFADHVTISHCTFAPLMEYGVYCTSDDLRLDSCIFAPSKAQHNVRFEISAAAASKGHRPANAVISNCVFADNIGTTGDPECLAAREIDRLDVVHCDFTGWVRIGNVINPAVTDTSWHARHILFSNCTWHKLRPGGSLVQVEHDVDIVLVNCTFPGSATDSPISIGDRSTCTLINTTIVCPTPAPGTPPMQLKPLVIASSSATVVGADQATVVYRAGGMN